MFEAYASRNEKSGTTLALHRQILNGSAAVCALMLALSFTSAAHAQTAWTGDTTGGSWFDATKWDTGVPDAADNSLIAVPGMVIISDEEAAEALGLIVANGALLRVEDGSELKAGANGIGVGINPGSAGLDIVGGGKVTSDGGIIVGALGATGTINVDGTDSELAATAGTLGIGVGLNSNGTLNVLDGASVTITENTQIGVNDPAVPVVDPDKNAEGKLNVSNGATFGTKALGVGISGGSGTLVVTGGGKVTATLGVDLGWAGGKGVATISDQGSLLDGGNRIVIGNDFDGTKPDTEGTLTVTKGATVKANGIVVGFGTGKGTLNIGTGTGAGIVDGTLVMSGASSIINFNHNDADYSFGNVIRDWNAADGPGAGPVHGEVNFIGTGTTKLTAANDYTAATNINAGRLIIADGASIANSSLTTVNTGGTLSGEGTTGKTGNVLVTSGGTIAQAAGDTLNVKNITFAAGSNYLVGADPNGNVGNIAADSATLQGGTVKVSAGSGNYAPGARYTILKTTTAMTSTDRFNSVIATDLTFLNAALDYAIVNQVDLTLVRNSTTFASIAATANQRAVAVATDGLDPTSSVYAKLVQQNSDGARQGFDALSGEVHASNQSALMSTALMVSDTINDHMAESFDKSVKPLRYAAWAKGFGTWMVSGADRNAAELDSTTGGILSGVDMALFSNWRVGLAGGYSQTTSTVDSRTSEVKTDGSYLAAYTGTRLGLFGVQLGGSYSWKDMSSTRNVFFPGYFETVRGSYSGDIAQAFGEVNYRYLDGTGLTLLPFAGFSYIGLQTDAFTETGAAGLSVAASESNVVFSTIGLRGSAFLGKAYGASFTSRGTLAWRHAYGDTETAMVASLAGSSPFIVGGVPIAQDAAFAELGLDVTVLDDVSVGIAWAGQFGNDVTEDQLKGELLYRW